MGAFDLLKNKKDDEEGKEDPIQKAEREFFEMIKKVNIYLKCEIFRVLNSNTKYKLYVQTLILLYFQEQEKRIAAKKESLGKSAEIED